ncbi:MAG: DUF2232 domain-containing protein [Gemmatimonadetes bacterium]|nr:DUF2232 domain-containing protein [Gemmatimonadota bacterium]
MPPRLFALTVAVLLAAAVAGFGGAEAALAPLISFAIPVVGFAWAATRGLPAALVAIAPAVVLVGFFAPAALPGVAAAAVATGIWVGVRNAGGSAWRAVLFATLPFALWTVFLAAKGYDPFPADFRTWFDSIVAESRSNWPPERWAELEASTESALAFARRTWVASEVTWFAALLAIAAGLARRLAPHGEWPAREPFVRLEVPDGFVGVLILGLAAVLLGQGVVETVGWNLVFASALVFAARGLAIQCFWMDRGRLGMLARVAYFLASVLLFLPVFAFVTSALGLFDAWFDFRRHRDEGKGSNPFSMFQQSSGDDQRGAE